MNTEVSDTADRAEGHTQCHADVTHQRLGDAGANINPPIRPIIAMPWTVW
jgi:hypothetical protein